MVKLNEQEHLQWRIKVMREVEVEVLPLAINEDEGTGKKVVHFVSSVME